MSFGICHLTVIPVRKDPRDQSEMTTQLLLGEHYRVLEESEKWAKIECALDEYVGFIDKKQLFEISSQDFDELSINEFPVNCSPLASGDCSWGKLIIPQGAILPYQGKGLFKIRKESVTSNAEPASLDLNDVEKYGRQFLNAPYLWGGKTAFGIDCSGLTQVVFRMCGISLDRDAYQQANQGEVVNLLEESTTGDLAFFDNPEGRITHVGIVLDQGDRKEILHASGKVRIDILDHQGIFDRQKQLYTHQLRTIRTYRH